MTNFAGCAVVISLDRFLLDRIGAHMLAFEGEGHVERFEGNFEDYEADKIRRLGPDASICKSARSCWAPYRRALDYHPHKELTYIDQKSVQRKSPRILLHVS